MKDKCQSIIDDIDKMMIRPANESYADIAQFFVNQDAYLQHSYNKQLDKLYTEPLSTGGIVYQSIAKACNDMINVHAYTEALMIYDKFIQRLENLAEDFTGEDRENIRNTISDIKGMVLETLKARDDYLAKRKSILAKYSSIIEELKK